MRKLFSVLVIGTLLVACNSYTPNDGPDDSNDEGGAAEILGFVATPSSSNVVGIPIILSWRVAGPSVGVITPGDLQAYAYEDSAQVTVNPTETTTYTLTTSATDLSKDTATVTVTIGQ